MVIAFTYEISLSQGPLKQFIISLDMTSRETRAASNVLGNCNWEIWTGREAYRLTTELLLTSAQDLMCHFRDGFEALPNAPEPFIFHPIRFHGKRDQPPSSILLYLPHLARSHRRYHCDELA
jgi:hypothetical protein